jgi:hypothetical protein
MHSGVPWLFILLLFCVSEAKQQLRESVFKEGRTQDREEDLFSFTIDLETEKVDKVQIQFLRYSQLQLII